MNLKKYNTEYTVEPFGFKNLGATCYFNAMVQSLLSCSSFNEAILKIPAEQQTQVIKQTEIYIGKAAALFSMKLKSVEITFDLKGRTAGMYRVYGNKREIRYNPYIFSKYFDDNFNTTVPHEVAHYITDIIYGLGKIKPHGKEWKAVMHAFNADASVTSNYDLSPS